MMTAWVCQNRNLGFSDIGSDFGGKVEKDSKNIFVAWVKFYWKNSEKSKTLIP